MDDAGDGLGLGLGRRHGRVRRRRVLLGEGDGPRLVVPVRLDVAVELGAQLGGTGDEFLNGVAMRLLSVAEGQGARAHGQEGDGGVDLDHCDGMEWELDCCY